MNANPINDEYALHWFDDNGVYHRDDGPALIQKNGTEAWYVHGELHRIGGPAVSLPEDNIQQWYIHGIIHRTDGPAIISPTGNEYYLNGEIIDISGDFNSPEFQAKWKRIFKTRIMK
jgi:hypothetical protein